MERKRRNDDAGWKIVSNTGKNLGGTYNPRTGEDVPHSFSSYAQAVQYIRKFRDVLAGLVQAVRN